MMEGGDRGQLGLGWALPGGICTLRQLHGDTSGDTDHRTAEGSQGSVTRAITPEILILA